MYVDMWSTEGRKNLYIEMTNRSFENMKKFNYLGRY
jgi:hypothetical protein